MINKLWCNLMKVHTNLQAMKPKNQGKNGISLKIFHFKAYTREFIKIPAIEYRSKELGLLKENI